MSSLQAISAKVKDIWVKPSWTIQTKAKYHWVTPVNAVLEQKDPTVELFPLLQRHKIMKYTSMIVAFGHYILRIVGYGAIDH